MRKHLKKLFITQHLISIEYHQFCIGISSFVFGIVVDGESTQTCQWIISKASQFSNHKCYHKLIAVLLLGCVASIQYYNSTTLLISTTKHTEFLTIIFTWSIMYCIATTNRHQFINQYIEIHIILYDITFCSTRKQRQFALLLNMTEYFIYARIRIDRSSLNHGWYGHHRLQPRQTHKCHQCYQ